MENIAIKKMVRCLALCLAGGSMMMGCGGGESQGSVNNSAALLADGEACSAAWASSTVYVGGNRASYGGRNFTAAYWTQNNNPSTSSGPAGSGQPWITGFTCGGVTTTTKASTTTTKASTTTTKASTTTTKASTTTTKAATTTTGATTTTTKATTTTTGTSSCPAYVAGTSYSAGSVVQNAGGYYSCTVAGWCSTGASAYEPGVGWAWTSAWAVANGSSCGGTTTTTKATTTTTKAATTTTVTNTTTTTVTQPGGLKIVGYTPSWSTVESTIQYNKLTHINYAFVLPSADGSLQAVPNPSLLQTIVTNAHAKGVKVVVSVGGWSDGNDSPFVSLASSSTGRNNFVNKVVSLVSQYNLDGIDIDWEYPDPGSEADNYALLMGQLSTAMHSRGKILTAAVVGDGATGAGVKNEVFGYVDFINLMAYDLNNANHSPYSYAQQSINYWSGRGLPASKTVLGVPYYARPSWAAYNTKVGQNIANACRDSDGSDYWNGIPTIRSKAQLSRNYGGIMTWELSQDMGNGTSLLTAMWEVITGAAHSYRCN